MHRYPILVGFFLAICCQPDVSRATLLRVDVVTGALAWINTTTTPLDIAAYSISSPSGNLVPENWMSIAGHYDIQGDGSVDPTNAWRILGATSENLAEFGGSTLGTATLAPDQTIELGLGLWTGAVPFDIVLEYVDGNNLSFTSAVALGGADFDLDGDVDGDDFQIWQIGFGITGGALIISGDANADGRVDSADLAIWREQFGAVDGAGSFWSMPLSVAAIPEPAAIVLALGCLIPGHRWRKKNRRLAG